MLAGSKKEKKRRRGRGKRDDYIIYDIYGTIGNLNTGYFIILRNFYCYF